MWVLTSELAVPTRTPAEEFKCRKAGAGRSRLVLGYRKDGADQLASVFSTGTLDLFDQTACLRPTSWVTRLTLTEWSAWSPTGSHAVLSHHWTIINNRLRG